MKYKLFDIIPDDIDELEAKPCYSIGELGCAKTLIKLSMTSNNDSLAYGFGMEDGHLHGIAGSYRQWDGSAQLWAILSQASCRYPISLTKICEAMVSYAVKKQELRRVSITVKTDYFQGNRFAQVLGFTLEGRMKKFLPDGADANLYARIF